MSITKFERDHTSKISYSFFNAFPKLITSIPVFICVPDLLQVTVSFNYDRYLVNVDSKFTEVREEIVTLRIRRFTSTELKKEHFNKINHFNRRNQASFTKYLEHGNRIWSGITCNPNLRMILRDRRTYGKDV